MRNLNKGNCAIKRFLDTEGILLQLGQGKAVGVVIQGVPKSINKEDVKEALSENNRIPISLVFTQLRKTAEPRAIIQLRELIVLRVTIESPRRKTATG